MNLAWWIIEQTLGSPYVVVVSAFLATTAALNHRRSFRTSSERMYRRLGAFVSRHWLVVILAWIALAVTTEFVSPAWNSVTVDGDLAYMPRRMTSVRGEQLIAAAFPRQKTKSQMALVIERADGPLTDDDFAVADRLAERFQKMPQLPIVDVWTYASEVVGYKLTSPAEDSGQATLVVLQLSNEVMATDNIRVLREVKTVLHEARSAADLPEGLRLGLTGSAAVAGDTLSAAAESVENTELTAVVLVLIILLVVYRAPALVLIPVATIMVSIFVSLDVVALLTQLKQVDGFEWVQFNVFKTTKIFIVVVLFGGGTDYCLFLIARYREELQRGLSPEEAVAETLTKIGDALAGSALTTILGLSMMFFADFGKFSNAGPTIALALTIATIACITLAPALLRAAGSLAFWPLGVDPHRGSGRDLFTGFWQWLAEKILARPGLIFTATVLLMAPLAYAGLDTQISYDLLNDLPAARESARGTRMFQQHFPAGDIGPVRVVAYLADGKFDTKEGERRIALLTGELYDLPGIVQVRSLTEPLGDKPGQSNIFSAAGRRKIAARRHPQTIATYLTQEPKLAGKVTRFDLVLPHSPFSVESIQILDRVDAWLLRLSRDKRSPWHGAQFEFTGTTAGIRDLRAVTTSDQWRIQLFVVMAVLAVIIVILKRPLTCIYLILTVVFSYLVTIGGTEVVFAWIYGETFHGLDWKVPLFLFVILVAVGEDYNIYLVTRVFEEQERYGLMEGLRVALVRTGGIITSCGLITAGSFISMMSGSLRAMLELGFALSIGVILDTFVVRPILVPSLLAWCYRRWGSDDPTTERQGSGYDEGEMEVAGSAGSRS